MKKSLFKILNAFCGSGFFYYLCSATNYDSYTISQSAVNARHIRGPFFMPGKLASGNGRIPTIYDSLRLPIRNYFTLLRDSIMVCCKRIGSRSFLSALQQTMMLMKAISLKAPAMPKIALWSSIKTTTVSNKLSFGIAGAVIAYAGSLLSADMIMYVGAILALLSIKPSEKKGGQK